MERESMRLQLNITVERLLNMGDISLEELYYVLFGEFSDNRDNESIIDFIESTDYLSQYNIEKIKINYL